MFVRRLAVMAAALFTGAAIAGCTSLGQLQAPDSNKSTGHIYNYTAIGASDAVGVGASTVCATAPVVIGPDTELMPSPANCPNGTGYVPDIANRLTVGPSVVNLTDLGISGAVIGPTERTLGNTYEPFVFGCNPCVPGDFLSDELPLIPSQQNTVTIFAGGNDTNAIFAHVAVACAACNANQIQMMIGQDVTNFGNDYNTLLGAVHQSFPFARIYVANLPNFGLIPIGVCTGANPASAPSFCSPSDPAQNNPNAQALLDAISTSIDAFVINGAIASAGVPVIDLECTSQSYNPANFSPDGFHPDDAGYSLFAAMFSTAMKNFGTPTPPQGNCPFSQAGTRLAAPRHAHLKYVRF